MGRTGKFIQDIRTGEYLAEREFTTSLAEAITGMNFAQAHRIARAHPKRELAFIILHDGKEEARLPLTNLD